MKCRLSNREVSFIYIHSAAGAAAAAAALCCFTVYFSFCYVDTVCGFTTEYLDLIDYNYYTAARRTSMYSYIPACCCVVCCYTAVDAVAAACCWWSSTCAGWQILLLWFTASGSSVFSLFIQTSFFSSRRRHTRSCLVSWARRCV